MSFDVAAEAYDRFMGRYSRLLSSQLADLASVRGGQRVLDVGCGTGATEAATRAFPSNALRGELRVTQPPAAEINGQPVRLAPGARIFGEDGLLRLTGTVAGQKLVVHYTRDPFGLVKDVWVLTPAERAVRPWPTTDAEAAAWTFDPNTQTWKRP